VYLCFFISDHLPNRIWVLWYFECVNFLAFYSYWLIKQEDAVNVQSYVRRKEESKGSKKERGGILFPKAFFFSKIWHDDNSVNGWWFLCGKVWLFCPMLRCQLLNHLFWILRGKVITLVWLPHFSMCKWNTFCYLLSFLPLYQFSFTSLHCPSNTFDTWFICICCTVW
jgi:hypothetical protein